MAIYKKSSLSHFLSLIHSHTQLVDPASPKPQVGLQMGHRTECAQPATISPPPSRNSVFKHDSCLTFSIYNNSCPKLTHNNLCYLGQGIHCIVEVDSVGFEYTEVSY